MSVPSRDLALSRASNSEMSYLTIFRASTGALAVVLCLAALVPARLHAQASEIPSAAPLVDTRLTPEERGRILLDQMVAALGGDAWLNRTTLMIEGHGAAFFHGQPNPGLSDFHQSIRLPASGQPYAERIGYLTDKSMILPGKKIDVVQVWTPTEGIEITYKGATPLPKDQVADTLRRRAHSLEEVIQTWIHAPGVVIVSEGTAMVERRLADKVTILSANNDAVTLQLDANTHLPLSRTFQWRNEQFKDHDEDTEQYDDYHTIQGIPTALTITRYRNGDMAGQRYLTKVVYNVVLAPELFDPTVLLQKKK